jgi:hypothetical protein
MTQRVSCHWSFEGHDMAHSQRPHIQRSQIVATESEAAGFLEDFPGGVFEREVLPAEWVEYEYCVSAQLRNPQVPGAVERYAVDNGAGEERCLPERFSSVECAVGLDGLAADPPSRCLGDIEVMSGRVDSDFVREEQSVCHDHRPRLIDAQDVSVRHRGFFGRRSGLCAG